MAAITLDDDHGAAVRREATDLVHRVETPCERKERYRSRRLLARQMN